VNAKKSSGKLGRPRAFDVDKTLDRAVRVFWRKGYEGASLSDLTKAMGINRPSLYAAFGDKEALFRKVLDRYMEGPAGYVSKALKEPTSRAVIERLLHETVQASAKKGNPKGCLMVQGALACGKKAEPVRRELIARRAAGEAAVLQRFERARAEDDLPANVSPADLARYVMAVLHGMAVEAASGASRAELQRIVEMALRVWRD
jgi:AcrR family transcriptional regulator